MESQMDMIKVPDIKANVFQGMDLMGGCFDSISRDIGVYL